MAKHSDSLANYPRRQLAKALQRFDLTDVLPGTEKSCRHCGDPIDGPPLTQSCPGPHIRRAAP
jgi:hypothetical protein